MKRSISTLPSTLGMRFTSSRSQRSRSLSAPELNVVSACTEQSFPRHPPKSQWRERYRYAPLGDREIRRLRLIGSHNRNEPLRGVIETVPFSTYSPYTAVSYVWGDNTQPFQLLVGEDQYVPLTASLNCLLRDFREYISETRKHAGRWVVVIWVDQLCINQDDDKEKGRQVKMMSEIYKAAEAVVIYTGPEKPGDFPALDFMTKFYNLRRQRNPEGRELSKPEWSEFLESFGDLPEDDDQIWDAIMNLLSGEWILRSWIFQEVTLNERTYILHGARIYPVIILIVFGSRLAYEAELPFGTLLRNYSLSIFVEHWTSGPPPWMCAQLLHTIGITRTLLSNQKQKATTFFLLQQNRNLKASLPRDKIYSLLGVAADVDSLGIVPDYSRPDVEVFTNLARRLFLQEQDLRILEYVFDAPISSFGQWPSWVPNWSYTGQSNRRIGGGTCVFKAADSVPPTLSFSQDGKSLIVKGILVDTVIEVLGVPCSGYFVQDRLVQVESSIFLRCKLFHEVYLKAMKAISATPTSPSIEERKRFILVTTLGIDMRNQPVDLEQLWTAFCLWMIFIVSVVETPLPVTGELTEQQVMHWHADFVLATLSANEYWTPLWLSFGRAMYVTSNGRLCMGPERSQNGDKIAVLLGGRMCYILRPVLGMDSQYEFVGDAFCEGLMQGEALADSKLANEIRDLIIV